MSSREYQPYDTHEIESVKQILISESKNATPLFFEVKIDGFMKIRKTNNVARFDELYSFINDKTKELVIFIYTEPNNDKKEWYKFRLKEEPETKSMNGFDIDAKVDEKMKVFEKDMEHKQTKEKLREEQEKIKSAEQYIEILENRIESMQAKPNHFGNWDLGKLAASTIEGIAVHYPKILEKVPVLNGIAKVIQEDVKSKPAQLNGSFEGDVSFKVKEQKTELSPQAQEHEQTIRQLVDFVGEHFDEQQRRILGLVIVELGEDTSQLQPVAELLNIDMKSQQENSNQE